MPIDHPVTSPAFKPDREIRFAVVMYGGVSLAIYMNGVALELLNMVRSTAQSPGRDLRGTELIYRALAEALHPKPRFVVDVISGTSASLGLRVWFACPGAIRSPKWRSHKRTSRIRY